MKRILALLVLISLAGCAEIRNAYDVVTGANVSPAVVQVAVNSFDALEATATNYLKLPRCNGKNGPICRDPGATAAIIPAVRAGRVARNNLETFIQQNPGQLGPSGLYNALQAASSTLQGIYTQYHISQ